MPSCKVEVIPLEPEFFSNVLGNIGIPAALCFYTLFEVNKNVKKLADSINRLADDTDKRLDKLETRLSELSYRVESLGFGKKITLDKEQD